MLTLYYVAATWLQSWRLSSTLNKIKEIRKKRGSIVLHQELPPYVYMVRSASAESRMEVNAALSKSCSNHTISNIKDLIWFSGNKKILSIYPQQELDVSGWVSVIRGRTQLPVELEGGVQVKLSPESRVLMLLEADYNTCVYSQLGPHLTLQVEKYGVALAWHVAEHLSLLFETDETRLASLCLAFMHSNLSLENGIKIIRIVSVKVRGSPYRIKNSETVPQSYAPLDPELEAGERKEVFVSRWRAHISMMATFCEAVQQVSQAQQEISVRHPGSGVGAVRLVPGELMLASEDEAVEDTEEELDRTMEEEEPYSGAGSEAGSVAGRRYAPEYSVTDSQTATNPTTVCCRSSTVSSLRDDTVSTDTVIPPDSTRNSGDLSMDTPASSLRSFPSTPLRSTVSTSLPTSSTKPPNILVFSESSSTADAVKSALLATLATNKYTVDSVSWNRLIDPRAESRLLVVHGDVPTPGPLISRLVSCPGSAAFVLCSDLLRTVLPMFRTAEVRPNELVRCSYKTWKHVPLVHHIFMYQPTPPANAFSQDHHPNVLPEWVEMVDESGCKQRLKVDVLGTEETWRTPSLLQVTFTNSNSTIIFSQVHLELEPGGGEGAERLEALRQSDKARLEILCDVLSKHLGLHATTAKTDVSFTPAYFLGNHERKQMVISELSERGFVSSCNSVDCGGGVSLKLCGKGAVAPPATASVLPLLLHACPQTFSTVMYFEELKSDMMGRLVIFSEVMSSSMDLVKGPPLHHGLAIIPLRQTHGTGRGGNSWLSPEGCGMFTLQLHVPLTSYLGTHLSLLQHIAGLAVVSAVSSIPGLHDLDIGLKWPNDIYANKSVKIGGIVTTSTVSTNSAICNIGCGMNVLNKEPTVCLNDLMLAHCQATKAKVEPLTLERYFALVFNKMEQLYDLAQSNHVDHIYRLYYDFWLHSDAEVRVKGADGEEKSVTIRGIDEFGFLMADAADGQRVTLHPDGNSFDMMAGLIMAKS